MASGSTKEYPELASAWRCFINYDNTSKRLKRGRNYTRLLIILLGVLTSFVAVAITYTDEPMVAAGEAPTITEATPEPTAEPTAEATSEPASATGGSAENEGALPPSNNIRILMLIALAILPILTSVVIAYASEFSPILAWAVYRVGSELVRREIYLYRTSAADYNTSDEQERRNILLDHLNQARKIEKIYSTDRLDEPILRETVGSVRTGGSTVPHLEQIEGEAYEKLKSQVSVPISVATQPFRDINPVWRFIRRRLSDWRKIPSPTDTSSGTPPEFVDNGFNELDLEKYIQVRMIPQLNWYANRVWFDYGYLRRWKVIILVMGGVGTAIVAVSSVLGDQLPPLAPLVAITTAITIAMGLFLELRMFATIYPIYDAAATSLEELLSEWEIMLKPKTAPAAAGAANVSDANKNFIVRVERVLQAEREQWMMQVIQSQTALEQKLARKEGGRSSTSGEGTARAGLATSLKRLADVALGKREFSRAQTLYEESLNSFKESSDSRGILECLEGLTSLASAQSSDPTLGEAWAKRAATLYGAINQQRDTLIMRRSTAEDALHERSLTEARAKLTPDAFKAAADGGKAFTLDQVIEEALKKVTP